MSYLRLYKKGSLLAVLLLLAIILIVKRISFHAWKMQGNGPAEELILFSANMDSLETAAPKAQPLVETVLALHSFDPNHADSSELSELGLRDYVVRNILRYREKGGRFRKPSDMARIYGMDENVYASLEPFIHIEPSPTVVKTPAKTLYAPASHPDVHVGHGPEPDADGICTTENMKVIEVRHIELNTADSAVFVAVRGIGAYTALKIMAYREALGGFVDVGQLDEIDGIRPENLENLKESAYADSLYVTPISLNTASMKHLQHHPYLSFPQARAIVELRRHRHQPITFTDLTSLDEFTRKDLNRLKPYLSD